MQKLFLILFMLPLFAQAQQDTLVISENNGLDGSFIKSYTNKWKVTYITPEGKEVPNKIWTDYGQVITLDGKKYYHRVQDLYDPQMKLMATWINMVEHETLLPVSFTSIQPTGKFSYYNFENKQVSGASNSDGQLVNSDTTLNQQIYDWNLYGMVLVGLPLKKGLVAKIPIFSVQQQAIQWIIVNIPEMESLTLPDGGKISTYKVVTNKNLTFWVSKEAPYVIRLESYMPNGAMMVWEMI